ncbi:MAG: ABC transporter substrate-binding protein [Acidimicrobiia bacterium]|nr:ABC transporter substrate-binding protein [Acidimicrobiia bacterium]
MAVVRRRLLVPATLAALGLVAAACGGDDGEDASTAATVDEGVKSGIESQLGGSTTTSTSAVEDPTTLEGWEELWSEQRAAIVARIQENGWGLNAEGTQVTGPEGFTMDLSACPAGWSNTEGLTDTEIKIGHPTALSGTLADYGNISRGQIAILDYYSQEGFFEDSEGKTRSVNMILKDDAYDPARTIPLVDELLDSEKAFAIQTLGSPSTMKVYDKLNQRCVPHPLPITGHPAWGDPVHHPWTTTAGFAYNTEAVLWGNFIEDLMADEFPDGVKVAALVMNNDFGKSYDSAFKAYIAQSPNAAKFEFVTETIEPSAPTVKDPMTTLAAEGADVFIAMTAGVSCTQAIIEAAENGMTEDVPYLFMPSTCKASSFMGKDKVGGDGSASEGWWVFGGGLRDLNSVAEDGNAFIEWARERVRAIGLDPASSGSFSNGIGNGWAMAQALKIGGELDGGLTRTNLILALRAIDMTNPMLVTGIQFNMNGNADAYVIEGSDVSRWNSGEQRWVPEGDIIDLSGKSSNCAWDQAAGLCG